ncbi:hypothetical protein NUW58_g541 [Xylaria curta]|uniref:Uncharacterized protein n=1 Tax=Xylaria curta TaxID=42375 RepID=A0ACC1PNV9_9PEZI|nr:hypothetical protein NUW58_g541 [Xylaria curta]
MADPYPRVLSRITATKECILQWIRNFEKIRPPHEVFEEEVHLLEDNIQKERQLILSGHSYEQMSSALDRVVQYSGQLKELQINYEATVDKQETTYQQTTPPGDLRRRRKRARPESYDAGEPSQRRLRSGSNRAEREPSADSLDSSFLESQALQQPKAVSQSTNPDSRDSTPSGVLRISITLSDVEPVPDVANEEMTQTSSLQNDEPQIEVLGIYRDLRRERHLDSTPTSALQPEGPTQRPTIENDLGVLANSTSPDAEQRGNSAGSGGSTESRLSITLGLDHTPCVMGSRRREPEPTDTASATRPIQHTPAEKCQGKDAANILDRRRRHNLQTNPRPAPYPPISTSPTPGDLQL